MKAKKISLLLSIIKRDVISHNYTQVSQSTLIAPQVELPQSWMNFSIEKTPVRSSTDLPYSACLPLS
jgi:hypothetical protein